MRCGEIQTGGTSFRKIRVFFGNRYFLQKSFNLGSIIEILGSKGVYLHEKCRTNPSRHLPGPKNPVKIKKNYFGVSGVRGEGLGGSGRIK